MRPAPDELHQKRSSNTCYQPQERDYFAIQAIPKDF